MPAKANRSQGRREYPPLSIDRTAEAINARIREASALYNRLVLVVGATGAATSAALAAACTRTGQPMVNVGLELSRRMLEFAADQRPLQARPLLEEITAEAAGDVVLLDNIAVLFEPSLQQDPLRLLQGASRNKTVVAAWTGELRDGTLRYAVPGHPEHRQYPAGDLLIVTVETGDEAP